MDSLTDLTLRNCPGALILLQYLSRSGVVMALKSFEFRYQYGAHDDGYFDDDEVLFDFLSSFIGLQSLETSAGVEEMDLEDMGCVRAPAVGESVIDAKFPGGELNAGKYNPFSQLDLECLGLACLPQLLNPFLQPLAQSTNLKILHVRQSGPDISRRGSWGITRFRPEDRKKVEGHLKALARLPGSERNSRNHKHFLLIPTVSSKSLRPMDIEMARPAEWAFGEHGIKSLKFLVFGDFSCQGRFADDTFMLRRNDDRAVAGPRAWRYYDPRWLEGRVPDLENLLDEHADFREACPAAKLFESVY
ncbi:Uu.00g115660.m01.CDS01 [Anthostomella pinea]|uniref:Uu.00g115660.m01.CDS01 n=1 Tax=Anthostomella pinea TaxID=933095 RepID=A0AAI8YGW7_9PEZI|nr:Uu.00g115660.m01.CDS01 [Anthostomella pinea]